MLREGIAILHERNTVKIDQRHEIREGVRLLGGGGETEPIVIYKQRCLGSGISHT